ncbi:MAG: hypothetical protein R2865_06520 [Deinococcales bacterium]
MTVVINSPYVEIGQVFSFNVTYGGSTTCTTDLYRQGENADTVMLQEYASGTCANGASVSLRHDAATDTLWWQSGQKPSALPP